MHSIDNVISGVNRIIMYVIPVAILCFIVVQPGMAQISPGKTVSGWEKQGNIITIPTTNAEVKLEFCTPSMVRVRASWDGEFAEPEPWMVTKYEWEPVDIESSEGEGFYDFETTDLRLRVSTAPLKIAFYSAAGKLLSTEKLADRKSTRLNSSHVSISY